MSNQGKKQPPIFSIESFELSLRPDELTNRFYGELKISGKKLGRPSKRIWMHQDKLKITHAEITHVGKQGQTVHEIARINHLKKRGELRLHTNTMLFAGDYELKLSYYGKLDDELKNHVFTSLDVKILSSDKLDLEKDLLTKLMPHVRTRD